MGRAGARPSNLAAAHRMLVTEQFRSSFRQGGRDELRLVLTLRSPRPGSSLFHGDLNGRREFGGRPLQGDLQIFVREVINEDGIANILRWFLVAQVGAEPAEAQAAEGAKVLVALVAGIGIRLARRFARLLRSPVGSLLIGI